MDRFEGRCHLDWWANAVTCLASIAVAVVITVTDAGWTADGHLVSIDDDERDGFALLCAMDPIFTLRFGDGSELAVIVHPAHEGDRFSLTTYTGPQWRSISHDLEL